MYVIRKEFRFCAAHRLVRGYAGKCTNLHGHNFTVRVELQAHTLNPQGMVEDFASLDWFKAWLDEHLDHGTLVAVDDPLMLYLKEHDQKHWVMDGNPTSERIARLLYCVLLTNNQRVATTIRAVEVDETCTCSARYEGGPA